MSATLTVTQELKNLPENFLLSLICKSREDAEIDQILKYFLKKEDVSGIYITLDKPSKTIKEELIRNKLDTDKLYFVDLITQIAGTELETTETLLSASPSNLTELSITLNTTMKNLKTKNKFILFDTLSTLFNYNQPMIVLKFVHYLTTTMRVLNVSGTFIIIKNQLDDRTISFISGLIDKTIEI